MLDVLYSMVGVMVAAGYLPQIIKLIKATLPCYDVSIMSWSMWAYTSSISLLYALFEQKTLDLAFVGVNSVNMICIASIICITLYKRRKYKIPPILPTQPVETYETVQNDVQTATEYAAP